MQNRTFLVLFRPIFAQKMKTATPKRFGSRSSKVVAAIWPEEPFELVISAEKFYSILVKTFFLGDHLFLGEKPPQSDSRAMKIWVKVAYSCLNLLKKPPPLHEILATRMRRRPWADTAHTCRSFLCVLAIACLFAYLPGPKVQQKDTSRSVIQKTS